MIPLLNWFRRESLERGLDRELQYHFDCRVADLTAAGIPEPEARRRVTVELGLAQVREEVRDVWLTRWFRDSRSSASAPLWAASSKNQMTLLPVVSSFASSRRCFRLFSHTTYAHLLRSLPVH